MRIKRIDITGFKSFMERTVFGFDDGITAVVGPNGCGKSNVVDAIRWAMGEQSAKNLRGRGMEDVIFGGSETHAPLSMAEVTLTFRVDEGDPLPESVAGLPEVSVTRRLFRNGESEYQINRTACRLLDVTELFLGTGVGTRAYSIIEQGRVGQIVSARPEDRRAFIEEAAGVTRYKARRRAAERKLEYTSQNLLRVNDIVAELGKQLASLERQAKKAEKYMRLKGEMRGIELHHFSHRWLELYAQRRVLEHQLSSLTEEERGAVEAVRALEDAIASRRSALERESTELEGEAQRVFELESRAQLEAQNLSHWRADGEATGGRLQAARGEHGEVAQRLKEVHREQGEREQELVSLQEMQRSDEVALEVKEEELRRSSALVASVSARLEVERGSLVDLVAKVANLESGARGLDGRRTELGERLARLRGELEALAAEERTQEAARHEVLSRVEAHRQTALELTARRGEEEAKAENTRAAFAESEVSVIALREELSERRSRLASLEEIQRNYEGFDRGVRAVMKKAGVDPAALGVRGLVADLLTAPPDLERAIEAALGERLQHVVVESVDRGWELVEYLKQLGEGRSTFVAVPTGEGVVPPAGTGGPELPGVLGRALDQVTVREESLRPLVERLLGGVMIAHDAASARAAALQAPELTFVTRDGELTAPGGVVTGGAMEGPAVGSLQKKREIADLAGEVARLEERYTEAITRHYELQRQLGHSEGVLKGLEKHRHAEELSLASEEKDLHQTASSLVKLREQLARVDSERAELERAQRTVFGEMEASSGEVAHAQADRAARESQVRLLASELETLDSNAAGLRTDAIAIQVRVAAGAERVDAARRAVAQLTAQGVELADRVARLAATCAEAEGHLADLERRVAEAEAGRADREVALASRRSALETRRVAHAEAMAQVRVDDGKLRELRGQLDSLAAGLSSMSLKQRELELESAHLAEQVEERHQVSMGHAVHDYHLLPMLTAAAQERMKELRAQVERMGEVNVGSISEHHEVTERYGFLSKQKVDLEESLSRLKHAIAKIDETSRLRFRQTFEVVNEKFQQVFPRLFGGGRASLTLTAPIPGEEPGVEILAQPPGKKLQSVSLFSGGEKALTAVALIFAIFLIKPTPFCLLDEVDAPLDEGNVGRYNEMVREMSRASQFILITHNKRTMEFADTLYGVTMEEPGISRLVTVKLREAVAANTDSAVA